MSTHDTWRYPYQCGHFPGETVNGYRCFALAGDVDDPQIAVWAAGDREGRDQALDAIQQRLLRSRLQAARDRHPAGKAPERTQIPSKWENFWQGVSLWRTRRYSNPHREDNSQ